ncbi:LOW QUALITY PROTEIN: X-box-binding protein 1 [Syngnathoides biaculeatus]|uniref:LOW QUALITY PROTEIN: X-box-binding protein 1 n=1 Tax=Syngnathoides biaculeatus TaxID=300417 RepID=UPI002ADDFE48|nr:LOW QUALITY PROTEIN: X-box-binding protein 1 [Syngnathoides biaculeatus]
MVVVATAGSGGAHKLLLISGKQSGGSSTASFGRPISVVLPSASSQASSDSESSGSAGPPVRKRQRLTHLSPEEKALRRKLKNRVAAQTARDRKKAKMGELEQQVLELELENQKLHIENRLLREKNSGLLIENDELKERLGLHTLDTKEKVQVMVSGGNEAGLGIGSSESAALRLRVSAAGADPEIPKPEDFSMDTDGPDAADNESDLLLGILDILDPELFLKSCEQECKEPPVLLVDRGDPIPAAAPGPLGTPSIKLEALNGLIHLDHIYTKPAEVAMEDSEESSSSDDDDSVMASFPVAEVVDEEDLSVKDEPEEVVIPTKMDDFLCIAVASSSSSSTSPAISGLDKDACLPDNYSDSGYEGSPSPFSDMSSSLCSENPWDDMFASELFPQLISV